MADEETIKTQTTEEQDNTDARLPRTQDELNALVQDRLARERKKYADYDQVKADAAEFKKLKESSMTEQQKKDAVIADLQGKLAERDRQIAESAAQVLRVEVLEDNGLPAVWASRVTGTTEDEIKADVATLKKMLGGQGKQVGGPARPGNANEAPTMNDRIRASIGRG